MLVFKIICLVLITLCAITAVAAGFFIKGKVQKDDPKKFKIVVKVRLGCFIAMLLLLLLVMLLK